MLFTDFQRSDCTPKANQESEFGFLDRSARPEIQRVRELLTDLLKEYPEEHRAEIKSRIISKDDTHFTSASFELFLHAVLLRMGCALYPHPELNNGSNKRPDFLVVTPDGNEFYLEAVLASIRNEKEPGAEARIGTTLDILSRATHTNFFVAVESLGSPDTQPSGKRLAAEALSWLDSLDPDEIAATIEESDFLSTPTLSWSHENWEVLLRPIPIDPKNRGKASTLIGAESGEAVFIDEWTPIRDAIRFKGSRYGKLDKSLLVAVNINSFHLDRIDEMQALYGQEEFIFTVGKPNQEPRFNRAPNGAWRGKSGPQATRVSGAWLFSDLNPYSLARRKQTIYFNPWALAPLPDCLEVFPHAKPLNEKMQWVEGTSICEVLGLSDDWPE